MLEKQEEINGYTALILEDVLPILKSDGEISKDFTVSEQNLLPDEAVIAIAENVENELQKQGYSAITRTKPHCGLIHLDAKK